MSKAVYALERAATRARQLAEKTGTPLFVFKEGRVVDLNRKPGAATCCARGVREDDSCPTPASKGVTIALNRQRPRVLGHGRPKDRSEQEIVIYRNALNQ
jgi:hypothetical protein